MVVLRRYLAAAAAVTGSLLPVALAQSSGRDGHGFVGHGISMFEPACAAGCKSAGPRSYIDCGLGHAAPSSGGHHHGGGGGGGYVVTPECVAVSEPWLKTVAYCIYTRCEGFDNSTLEQYWRTELISRHDEPQPMWSYGQSLHTVLDEGIPTETLDTSDEHATLNKTVLVDYDAWLGASNNNRGFTNTEIWHVNMGLIILASCVGIPFLCSLLRFIPFPKALVSSFNAHIIQPPVLGPNHNVPILRNMAVMPTRGQFLFLLYIFFINILASFVGYDFPSPDTWTREMAWLTHYGNRVGVLSFANMPLIFLFAGRNNLLLWLTNWSYSTFLLLHRWIGFICVLQAAIHSAVYLDIYIRINHDLENVVKIEYWIWGIVATVALVLILPFSILPLRKRLYEVFHAAHIVLAVITLVGSWYHIIWRYERQWGYENWLLIAIGIWSFDWLVRALRVARNGVKRAHVTDLGDDYLRVDVPGLDAHGHVYLYFPTLSWRIWESHPFSVMAQSSRSIPGGPLISTVGSAQPKLASLKTETGVNEEAVASSSSSSIEARQNSVLQDPVSTTLFIRKLSGMTIPLAKMAGKSSGIPVLVESSYGDESKLFPGGGHVGPSAEYPNLITIAGGVGITAVMPILNSAQSLHATIGSRKLFWGVRAGSEALVASVQDMIVSSTTAAEVKEPVGSRVTETRWGNIDVQISRGGRFDIRALLKSELSGASAAVGTTVFVCGPPGMADEVRNVVSGLARHGAVVRYVEEAFSW